MIQEEKELLLKDLCARLPYKVKINVNGEEDTLLELGVDTGWVNASYNIEDVKSYLRPMSSMTKEERKECNKLRLAGGMAVNVADYTDWLNSHHFDYRGLIEKGLALEAPKEMYNLKKK